MSTDNNSTNTKLALIAACTKGRPIMLKACLESLAAQQIVNGCELKILIVENDNEEKSKYAVDEAKKNSPYEILYVLHKTPGIPNARNVAINKAIDIDADYLLFLDDDEEADPSWASGLIKAAHYYDADCIQGKVIYQYPTSELWVNTIIADKNKTTRPEGKVLRTAATNNVLISKNVFSNFRFDQNMQYTGGSDTDFFRRASKKGHRITYTHKAIVRETVTHKRCSLSWQFQREARNKAISVYVDNKLLGSARTITKHTRRSIFELLKGLVFLIISLPFFLLSKEKGKSNLFIATKFFAASFGRMVGLRGRLLNPYRTIDGH